MLAGPSACSAALPEWSRPCASNSNSNPPSLRAGINSRGFPPFELSHRKPLRKGSVILNAILPQFAFQIYPPLFQPVCPSLFFTVVCAEGTSHGRSAPCLRYCVAHPPLFPQPLQIIPISRDGCENPKNKPLSAFMFQTQPPSSLVLVGLMSCATANLNVGPTIVQLMLATAAPSIHDMSLV